jgi:uncharacterized protein (TIGR02597 family)
MPGVTSVATAASGATLTIKASGVTLDQFKYAPPQTNTYYVQFKDGALTGQRFVVTGNTASNDNGTPSDPTDDTVDLTLDSAVSITGTPAITIKPYWTLGTLFPGGKGVGVSVDPYSPVAQVFFTNQSGTGVNRSLSTAYLYHDGSSDDFPVAGWYNSGDLEGPLANDLVVNPEDMFVVRKTSGGSSANLVFEGEVPDVGPTSAFVVRLVGLQDNYVGMPFPVDITLPDSGLFDPVRPTTGPVRVSPDPYSPLDTVFIYRDNPTGFNQSTIAAYLYHDGTSEDFPVAGWYDTGNLEGGPVTAKVLKAGRPFAIRKGVGSPSSSDLWQTTVPYPLP